MDLSQLKYVALSYVWGGKQRITLQRSNYANLQNRGSLVGRVPTTIEDALYLTNALGVQYLWVDALCIIQDNNADKEAQIGNMGNVYSHSLFTIIAAAGGDAEAGLPGIRVPRRAVQEEVLIRRPGSGLPLSLITMLNPRSASHEHHTKGTVWTSRGWTLQERALTKRAIIVMKEQVLWACGKSSWAEETYSETSLARVSWFELQESEYLLSSSVRNWFAADDETDQIWYKLPYLVNDFTERKLTIPGDAYHGFAAILQQFRKLTGEHFLWGLPAARFELGLCWEPHRQGLRRRSCLTTLEMTSLKRRVPFPSWSWIGWEGAIILRIEDRHVELG